MEYNELMQALAANLGLDELVPDADGIYSLSVDDSIVSFVEVADSGLLDIIVRLCPLPAECGEKLYRILLTSMAPGAAAENYNFFIGQDDLCIYLRHTEIMANLNAENLRQVLEDFIDAMDEWRSSISDFRKVAPVIDKAAEDELEETRSFGLNMDGFMQV